jgi:hypothetical protein
MLTTLSQEWKIDYEICVTCVEHLENVCAFRDMCIRSYLARKGGEKPAELAEDKTLSNNDSDYSTSARVTATTRRSRA